MAQRLLVVFCNGPGQAGLEPHAHAHAASRSLHRLSYLTCVKQDTSVTRNIAFHDDDSPELRWHQLPSSLLAKPMP